MFTITHTTISYFSSWKNWRIREEQHNTVADLVCRDGCDPQRSGCENHCGGQLLICAASTLSRRETPLLNIKPLHRIQFCYKSFSIEAWIPRAYRHLDAINGLHFNDIMSHDIVQSNCYMWQCNFLKHKSLRVCERERENSWIGLCVTTGLANITWHSRHNVTEMKPTINTSTKVSSIQHLSPILWSSNFLNPEKN